MNIRFSELSQMKIQAQDGEIGNVHDVLFDENRWIVRYVVVDTGGWLTGRKVLVAPIAIEEPETGAGFLPVSMTKEQVKDSPDIRTDLPLSQDQEVEYHNFFRWPYYWGGGGVYFGGVGVDPLAYAVGDTEVSPDPHTIPPDDRDFSLRSAREVNGFKLAEPDGQPQGEVTDFLIDTSNWTVSHLVVKPDKDSDATGLVPVDLIRQVGYPDEVVVLQVALSHLRSAPSYDHATALDQAYLENLARYYRNEPVGRQ